MMRIVLPPMLFEYNFNPLRHGMVVPLVESVEGRYINNKATPKICVESGAMEVAFNIP